MNETGEESTAKDTGRRTRPLAVVTGSSSGIGREIALHLAKSGFDLVIHGCTNRAGAERTAEQVARHASRTDIIMADLSNAAGRTLLFDEVSMRRECPSVLINNAGADVLTGGARDWSFEKKLEQLWHTDVAGTVMLSRMFGSAMYDAALQAATDGESTDERSARFSIVNIGWDQAEIGMEGDSGEMFAAIKGAVMSFTRSLAKSLAPNVRVNAVAPGWIRTDWGQDTSDYWDRRATAESLAGRWGTPADVAAAVGFLCTPEATFVNGQVISVNGGFSGRYLE